MGEHHGDRPDRRRPVMVAAALIAGGAAAAALATATLRPGASPDTDPAEQLAQQRCTSEVLTRLVRAENATLSDLRTETSVLDLDGRDFSSLNASEALTGVDTGRISVLNVSGTANAPSEVGTTLRDHFDCRAYFVDGALTHTLVVFDHGH